MAGKKPGSKMMFRPLLLLLGCSTIVLLFIVLSGAQWNFMFDSAPTKTSANQERQPRPDSYSFKHNTEPLKINDKLLDGLLTTGFDEAECRSRYEAGAYWKASNHKPSPYLIKKLRNYEARHKKCGPNTEYYRKATELLKSGNSNRVDSSECKYVIWLAEAGLGNRLIALASAFLYALVTDKVLLASIPNDMRDILCEPFPETTWLVPDDFPVKNYVDLNPRYPNSLGNILRSRKEGKNIDDALQKYVYLHVMHDSSDDEKKFFCDEAQDLIKNVPWLVLRANNYFGPGLFLIPKFRSELNQLFPEKEPLFHHLGRYLLHPTNYVWGGITRYYNSYLVHAKERLGLQIRVFSNFPVSFETMLGQVLNCTLKEAGLLPEVTENSFSVTSNEVNLKAVLVTSLTLGYFEKLRNMYYERSTVNGELIAVFQPSHEELQHTEEQNHNAKALQEMYLLSFSDNLVTTAWSTFGYVAQSLGGLRPWIIMRPGRKGPICSQGKSIEPCFQNPPLKDCNGQDMDAAKVLPFLQNCEDAPWAIRLFD